MSAFDFDTLLANLGDRIALLDAAPPTILTMTDVRCSSLDGDDWEAFVLMLKGDAGQPLSQGTYRFAHPAFGELDLFMSPKSATRYEIAVTRRRDQVNRRRADAPSADRYGFLPP